jgi:hypothetical protein
VVYAPLWAQSLEIVNVINTAYGPIEASATITSRNSDSVTIYGERTHDVDSRFASSTDAQARGNDLANRRGYPRWFLPGLAVAGLVTPRIGEPVNLSGLPSPAPLGSEWSPIIEGWIDTLTADEWTTTLQFSDPVASGVSLPWELVPATITWGTVAPACRWEDTYALVNLTGGA